MGGRNVARVLTPHKRGQVVGVLFRATERLIEHDDPAIRAGFWRYGLHE